jgi:chromosome segregation ATPase
MDVFRTAKAIDRLEDRLARVETVASDLGREARKLELEFTDLYDKVRHQMSRMAKRDALARKGNGDDPQPILNPETGEEMDPISASIHARRGSFLRKT